LPKGFYLRLCLEGSGRHRHRCRWTNHAGPSRGIGPRMVAGGAAGSLVVRADLTRRPAVSQRALEIERRHGFWGHRIRCRCTGWEGVRRGALRQHDSLPQGSLAAPACQDSATSALAAATAAPSFRFLPPAPPPWDFPLCHPRPLRAHRAHRPLLPPRRRWVQHRHRCELCSAGECAALSCAGIQQAPRPSASAAPGARHPDASSPPPPRPYLRPTALLQKARSMNHP
jgi:hypothetical protein